MPTPPRTCRAPVDVLVDDAVLETTNVVVAVTTPATRVHELLVEL